MNRPHPAVQAAAGVVCFVAAVCLSAGAGITIARAWLAHVERRPVRG